MTEQEQKFISNYRQASEDVREEVKTYLSQLLTESESVDQQHDNGTRIVGQNAAFNGS